jgi:hypothetical protein
VSVYDNPMPCKDCGFDTLPLQWPGGAEWYMVTDEVWTNAGMGPAKIIGLDVRDLLCIGCLEIRLQRKLTPADFKDVPLNDLRVHRTTRFAWSFRTERLINRLGG